MNEQEQAELERLKRRQEALQMQLATLSGDIERLASRLNEPSASVPEIHPLEIAPLETVAPAPSDSVGSQSTEPLRVPPPLPPVIPTVTTQIVEATPEPVAAASEPVFIPPAIPSPKPRETFEMKVGTYWLVRIGIVMLLTGLVFLGTYAYKNYIGKIGAGGKVALLYTASAALLGFGGWLQRKREKESLRNYGQVLFAGGLAAVYFTTYAAHYVEVLRVIASPVVDALLLMAWAGFTVWIADRRKSEVLALFAVGLAYYTSAITDVGFFTLGSNLVLTAAAVFFLVRNRWTTLSFISVVATYGGFGFWRFHHGDWGWDARAEELMRANLFLGGYWLFFTAAVFFSRGSKLVNANRALFASLNNGAFFGLVLLSMMRVWHGHFWQFALGFGTTLLGASLLARRFIADEPAIKNTYLLQGLTLITVGLIARFAGVKLALILAAESVILTVLGHQQKNLFVRAGGYITAALSAGWVLMKMSPSHADMGICAAIGVAFLFNAWWEQRHDAERATSLIRSFTSFFVALSVAVFGIGAWHAVSEPWHGVAWMVVALVLTAMFYALRVPELPIFSQALAIAAQAFWLYDIAFLDHHQEWIIPASLATGTMALSHWWQRQRALNLSLNARNGLQLFYGLALAGWVLMGMTSSSTDIGLGVIIGASFLFTAWSESRGHEEPTASVMRPFVSCFIVLAIGVCVVATRLAVPEEWRAVAWMVEAVALTAAFYLLRIPELPILAQSLAVVAQGYWFFQFALRAQRPSWLVPATLVAGTLALSHWWQRQKPLAIRADVRNVLQIIYALALVGVIFFWFKPDFAPAAWLVFLCALAIGITIYGVATRAWALAACAQVFLIASSIGLFSEFATDKQLKGYALVPLMTWLVLGTATTAWLARRDIREGVRRPLLQISMFYRGVSFALSLWWIYSYLPARNYFWVLCVAGLSLLALAGWLKNREALVFSGLFLVVGFIAWFAQGIIGTDGIYWPNALALLAILAAQQAVRRQSERLALPLHMDSAIILVVGIALWLFVSRWVVMTSGAHFLLTVSWAGLAAALFAAGFALRERMHRWLGLGILACAVGRVFLSDVWKLEQIYRILSFIALGVVLLALGFIYNKYQDKIRQWL